MRDLCRCGGAAVTHIIEKRGNLFTSTAPALAQGVNIRGAMSAGIANDFRRLCRSRPSRPIKPWTFAR